MKKFITFFAAMIFASAMVFGFSACKSNSDDDDDDDSKKSSKTEIVGHWVLEKECKGDDCKYAEDAHLILRKNGSCLASEGSVKDECSWQVNDNVLSLISEDGENTIYYTILELNDETMVLQRSGSSRKMYLYKQ